MLNMDLTGQAFHGASPDIEQKDHLGMGTDSYLLYQYINYKFNINHLQILFTCIMLSELLNKQIFIIKIDLSAV
jgi:hypothetical protein